MTDNDILNDLMERARGLRQNGDYDAYLSLLQIIERSEIIPRMETRIAEILGEEVRSRIFEGLPLPPADAPPSRAVPFTRGLVERLIAGEREPESPDRRRVYRALSGNAHGIPPAAFDREREFFEKAPSLEIYLRECHGRAVETLRKHAESGEVWFEQIITGEVVEFVRSNREILGGVLREGKIYLTKIPYDPAGWLRERDPRKKRYLACHCPMARESLNGGESPVNPLWCACSAGFAAQKFSALFGEEVRTEVVSSLLGGDDLCRFAIIVPPRILTRYQK